MFCRYQQRCTIAAILRLPILLQICAQYTKAATSPLQGCSHRSYVIEPENLIEGGIISRIFTDNLNDCIEQCNKNAQCTGTNFLLDMDDRSVCLLMDSKAKTLPRELPIRESIMYSASPFCMSKQASSQCDGLQWSFQKYANQIPTNPKLFKSIENIHKLDECLSYCVQKGESCKAALFNRRTMKCYLSRITIQSVHTKQKYFKRSTHVDLYENNCAFRDTLNAARCHFQRVHSSGLTDIFDERLSKVESVEDCERLCLRWRDGMCRSYTYDKSGHICYLSHVTSRSLGLNPLDFMTNSNLSTADLDDCFQFQLKCTANGMKISGSSMKLFSGSIKTKSNGKSFCTKSLEDTYQFETEMDYGGCGIQKTMYPYPTFSSVIVLKEGSTNLVTIRDKIIQVNCRMHDNVELLPDRKLSFQLEIDDENATRKLITESIRLASSTMGDFIPGPKFKLEVLDAQRHLTDVVNVGDSGYILITLQQQHSTPKKDAIFLMTDLSARNIKTNQMIPLIDSDGCVVDKRITQLKRISNNQLEMKIMFTGFQNESEVIYEGIVKSCRTNEECYPKCLLPLWEDAESEYDSISKIISPNSLDHDSNKFKTQTKRHQRHSPIPNASQTSRRFDISEDVYKLRSINKLTILDKIDQNDDNMLKDRRRTLLSKNNSIQDEHFLSIDLDNAKSGEYHREPSQLIASNSETSTNIVSRQKITRIPAYVQCICEDYNCLFTVLLVCVQIMLIISGIGLAVIYVKKWKQYHQMQHQQRQRSDDPPVQYEYTVDNE